MLSSLKIPGAMASSNAAPHVLNTGVLTSAKRKHDNGAGTCSAYGTDVKSKRDGKEVEERGKGKSIAVGEVAKKYPAAVARFS